MRCTYPPKLPLTPYESTGQGQPLRHNNALIRTGVCLLSGWFEIGSTTALTNAPFGKTQI